MSTKAIRAPTTLHAVEQLCFAFLRFISDKGVVKMTSTELPLSDDQAHSCRESTTLNKLQGEECFASYHKYKPL